MVIDSGVIGRPGIEISGVVSCVLGGGVSINARFPGGGFADDIGIAGTTIIVGRFADVVYIASRGVSASSLGVDMLVHLV